jgi:hypothetical protein
MTFSYNCIEFWTSSAFELGSNANWTSRIRSAAFGLMFDQLPEPGPLFSSAFAKIVR